MTKEKLMNDLIINNGINALSTQDYADALAKPFLRIRGVVGRTENSVAVPFKFPDAEVLTDYMLLDDYTSVVPIVSPEFVEHINRVMFYVLDNNFCEYYCDFKAVEIDDKPYLSIKLQDEEKQFFIEDYGNAGVDIMIVIEVPQQEAEE